MQQQILDEHRWLEQLVGEWTFESDCIVGPDQPSMKHTGREVVRSFGGLWTIGEGEAGDAAASWKSIITLGYDPRIGRFVGTFVATMMTHLWIYNGSLDESRKVLTLDADGPNFTTGAIAKYQDIFEILDANNRTLSSRILGDDGKWTPFMKAHYKRTRTA